MGAGKEAPGGVDGAAEPPPPVVLKMVLHCAGCAKKVRNSIKSMPGVQAVVADAASNRVVVAGTADAAALKARIESRTKKPVEIVSSGAGAGPAKPPAAPAAAEKKSPDKENPDKGGGGADKGDKPGSSKPQPPKEEDAAKKQPPTHTEEKKPTELQETTVLLKIRLHCDGCADRIRRRIYKIKGVKHVELEGNAKDEVKVTGTMDVPAMVAYLTKKLNRAVEAVAPGKKDKGGSDEKKDKGAGDGEKKKDKAAGGDHVVMSQDKGKGIEVTGPSMASAAASVAPAPVQPRTHHVSPYGQVPYPQPQGPPPSYYSPYGGNADGAGYAGAGGYYQQQQHPSANSGGYYQQQHPGGESGGYYQQPREAGGYYQQQHHPSGGYYQQENPNPQAYQPSYPPPYHFDTAPPPQMFSDENPNSCSVM
ncbi:heavy metal-associated isoprenylated plant protein 3-like [Triticum dicoccoides]|uniref:heavy metal-associated isoprenylated plant protein 3-like n=1 Tax=Triticum dicoccoides TaxID=85692 RepID=UPI000E79021F|nr:heavy metal-associated isoprenylated plant protein 3-like [Triticum dicoccoides]